MIELPNLLSGIEVKVLLYCLYWVDLDSAGKSRLPALAGYIIRSSFRSHEPGFQVRQRAHSKGGVLEQAVSGWKFIVNIYIFLFVALYVLYRQ